MFRLLSVASNRQFIVCTYMINLNCYRTTLFVAAAGLLACGSAQAQSSNQTLVASTDGSAAVVATTPSPKAESATTLRLNAPPAPESAAAYYDGSRKDLHQSLSWMQETNAVAPTYWNLYTEARIRLQLQDYAGARASAEQAYQLALKAMPVSQEYIALSAAVIDKAHKLAQR